MHHFGAIGIVNGLAVLADRETRTQWDHITGEAFAGPLTGAELEAWPVHMTTVAAARQEQPNLMVHVAGARGFQQKMAQVLYPRFILGRVWLPPPFYLSMSKPIDPRLDRLAQGLGVIVGKEARYYPISAIPAGGLERAWGKRILRVTRGAIDGVPRAIWTDNGEEPMQLLSRWYGFAVTYPHCEVYGVDQRA